MVEGTQRRLTTIVAADIAGFSRLVGIDEEGTLSAQRSHRTELIEPLLAKYYGRIANTAGDSFLFEFPSAVEAVRCRSAAILRFLSAIPSCTATERLGNCSPTPYLYRTGDIFDFLLATVFPSNIKTVADLPIPEQNNEVRLRFQDFRYLEGSTRFS